MIRYAVQVELSFSSAANASAFATDLRNQYDRSQAVVEYEITAGAGETGQPVVTGWVRFETPAAQQSMVAQVQSMWNSGQQARRPLAGSRVVWHECYNDEDVRRPCTGLETAVKA